MNSSRTSVAQTAEAMRRPSVVNSAISPRDRRVQRRADFGKLDLAVDQNEGRVRLLPFTKRRPPPSRRAGARRV